MNTQKTSQYYGVSWCRYKNKWRCAIRINGVQINRYFLYEHNAAKKYNELILEYNLQDSRIMNLLSG